MVSSGDIFTPNTLYISGKIQWYSNYRYKHAIWHCEKRSIRYKIMQKSFIFFYKL